MTSTRTTTTTKTNHHYGTLVALVAALALVASLLLMQAQNAQAAFPGQNGKIVFDSLRDGNEEIYSMNANGSRQKRLTNNGAFDGLPDWGVAL